MCLPRKLFTAVFFLFCFLFFVIVAIRQFEVGFDSASARDLFIYLFFYGSVSVYSSTSALAFLVNLQSQWERVVIGM